MKLIGYQAAYKAASEFYHLCQYTEMFRVLEDFQDRVLAEAPNDRKRRKAAGKLNRWLRHFYSAHPVNTTDFE